MTKNCLLTPSLPEMGQRGARVVLLAGLGKKDGTPDNLPLYPPRKHDGGTVWRRLPRDDAASMTHIDAQ
jgi:hypothetical protein